jgi:signal transduction histidine kinase
VKYDAGHLLDAAVVVLAGAVVGSGVGVRADPSTRPLALTLALAAVAVLVLRRRAPTATLVLSGGLVLALFGIDRSAGTVAVIAPAIALYSLALTRGRIHLVAAVVAAAVAVAVADIFLAGGHAHGLQTAGHVALVAVPVLAAEALRNRRSYVRLLLERLELAERTREEEAQRRAEQERRRIARELHDVVAHTLTTINVQAGVAGHLLDRDPHNVRDALATIEAASHDALDELRAILGVLREDGSAQIPLEPLPDLAAVDALIEQARATGLLVNFEVEGDPAPRVPEAVQLAAYRILQESLTNARRHSPGADTHVRLVYGPDRLLLTVESSATRTGDGDGQVSGVGIVGMRERAAALGGTLTAAHSNGSFRVEAELPYRRGT